MKRDYVMESPGEMKTQYEAHNKALLELGKDDGDIVLLYGDFPRGAAGEFFQEKHPDRIFDVGIAEANLVTTAAGLAAAGKIPFTHCHGIFAVGRAYNQIRQNVAYDKLNVKVVMVSAKKLANNSSRALSIKVVAWNILEPEIFLLKTVTSPRESGP